MDQAGQWPGYTSVRLDRISGDDRAARIERAHKRGLPYLDPVPIAVENAEEDLLTFYSAVQMALRSSRSSLDRIGADASRLWQQRLTAGLDHAVRPRIGGHASRNIGERDGGASHSAQVLDVFDRRPFVLGS